MTKLNQIIAVEKGVKTTANREITNAYHEMQKAAPLAGISRTYQPKDDEGDNLPPESTLVQIKVPDLLSEIGTAMTRLLDVTFTKDSANQVAKANVVVDGTTVVTDAPVSHLLFLEKNLTDLHTIVSKAPVLDPAERWTWDDNTGAYATDVTQTTRTKKVPRNHVKAAATDKHPAQVELYYEDVIVGTWSTTKFSGAIPASRRAQLVERIDKLRNAVKVAREEANSIEITDRKAGDAIFGYLLAE